MEPKNVVAKQKCIAYIEKLPFMVIFLHNLYILVSQTKMYRLYRKMTKNVVAKQNCIDCIEKLPFMVIFLHNLYILVSQTKTFHDVTRKISKQFD